MGATAMASRAAAPGDVDAVEVEQVRSLGDHEADVAASFDPALGGCRSRGSRRRAGHALGLGAARLCSRISARCSAASMRWCRPQQRSCASRPPLYRRAAAGLSLATSTSDLAGVGRGRRVLVGVEVDEDDLVDGDGLYDVSLGKRIGQGEQPRLSSPSISDDPPLGPSRVRIGVGNDLVQEDEEASRAALEIADRARGEALAGRRIALSTFPFCCGFRTPQSLGATQENCPGASSSGWKRTASLS